MTMRAPGPARTSSRIARLPLADCAARGAGPVRQANGHERDVIVRLGTRLGRAPRLVAFATGASSRSSDPERRSLHISDECPACCPRADRHGGGCEPRRSTHHVAGASCGAECPASAGAIGGMHQPPGGRPLLSTSATPAPQHLALSSYVADCAACTRSNTSLGPSGVRVTTTPNGASASLTALATAAGEPIAPPSPRPFTPPALVVESVSM